LRCDGILLGYTTWVHHGENYDRPSIAFVDVPNISRNMPTSCPVQDGKQDLLLAAFASATDMAQGEAADDFQSRFADMEHNAPEDIADPTEGDDLGRDQNIYARFLTDAQHKIISWF
jgi:hypothetical protein